MKTKRLFALLVVVILTVIGVSGCSMESNKIMDNTATCRTEPETVVESEKTLNQRQRDILESKGLSTDYNDLSPAQKEAIIAIEEMLSVTEAKYGIELCFISYETDSWGGSADSLMAFPKGGMQELESFEIMREKVGDTYVIIDTYVELRTEDLFSAYLQVHAESVLGEGAAKVYATVTSVALDTVPATADDIPHNVDGFWIVFVDGGIVDEDTFRAFAASYATWKKENGFSGSVQLILMKKDVNVYLTRFNYTDYLSEEYYLLREYCNS